MRIRATQSQSGAQRHPPAAAQTGSCYLFACAWCVAAIGTTLSLTYAMGNGLGRSDMAMAHYIAFHRILSTVAYWTERCCPIPMCVLCAALALRRSELNRRELRSARCYNRNRALLLWQTDLTVFRAGVEMIGVPLA